MSLALVPPVFEAFAVGILFIFIWYIGYLAVTWVFAGAYSALDKVEDYAARLEHGNK